MSNDSFTTTTTTGYFSRIGKSLAGLIIGPLLIVGSVILLFWNEGRSVHTAADLNETEKVVVSVPSETVDPANDKKVVYVTGKANTEEELSDSQFNVSRNALSLERKTQIYVWKENEKSSTQKNLGGSETTTTTYTYEKIWSDRIIESKNFEHPEGHTNPTSMAVDSEKFVTGEATLGAFHLDKRIVDNLDGEQQLNLNKEDLNKVEEFDPIKLHDGGFYLGANPSSPQVGDISVKYFYIDPTEVSVVAAQSGKNLVVHTASRGTSIGLIQSGTHSAAELFNAKRSENTMITWGLRLLGLMFCIIGFALIMKPLSVIADFVPFIGTIIGAGTGFIAGVLGLVVSTTTIAIAWIFYRPIIGITLLAATGGFLYYYYRNRKKAAVKSAAASADAPVATAP